MTYDEFKKQELEDLNRAIIEVFMNVVVKETPAINHKVLSNSYEKGALMYCASALKLKEQELRTTVRLQFGDFNSVNAVLDELHEMRLELEKKINNM